MVEGGIQQHHAVLIGHPRGEAPGAGGRVPEVGAGSKANQAVGEVTPDSEGKVNLCTLVRYRKMSMVS